MKHRSDIHDELLTNFLDGAAAVHEDAAVLDYAAQSDEHADELLDMALAVRAQQREWQRQRRRRRACYWAAAVVALFLATGAVGLFVGRGSGTLVPPSAPTLATTGTADSVAAITVVPADSSQSSRQHNEAVRQRLTQQEHTYKVERLMRVAASHDAVRCDDSTAAQVSDTIKTCLKSITL